MAAVGSEWSSTLGGTISASFVGNPRVTRSDEKVKTKHRDAWKNWIMKRKGRWHVRSDMPDSGLLLGLVS